MKLFFCDICNESIPLQDIKENKSTTIKGKIFCCECNPLNEIESTSSGSGSGVGGGLIGVMIVLLLAVAGALGYLIYEMKFAQGEGPALSSNGSADSNAAGIEELKNAVATMRGRLDALSGALDLPAQVAALQEAAAGQAAFRSRVSQAVAELQEGLVAVGGLRERVDAMALALEGSGQSMERIGAAIESVKAQLAAIEARPVASSSGGDSRIEGGGDAEPGPELDAELIAIVKKLSAADPMARWEAVDQIRRRRESRLVGDVIPLLDDRDTFVRAQAIYTLGELKAMPAVPRLVKLLRDDEIMIREEALTSLVVITGQNFKFEVTGGRNVREKGIRKWEDWLDKNEDKFE